MKTIHKTKSRLLKAASCLLVLCGLVATHANAQNINTYTFAQASGGVGNYAMAGAGANLTATAGTYDDNNFAVVTLPFTFTYHGAAFTTVGISANGYISLGAATSTSYAAPGSVVNSIAAFNADLDGNTANGAWCQYATSGPVGSRVFTVEWKKWGFFSAATAAQSFEIKLYETSNTVQMCYAPNTPVAGTVHVGLTGATTGDVSVRTTTTNWAATTAGTAASTCTYSATVFPANNLTFQWTSAATCAAMVFSTITTQGYTSIQGGTTTSLFATGANNDDNGYAVQTIPFSFTYHGATFTSVGVSANGYCTLGAATTNAYSNSFGTYANTLSPLSADLDGGNAIVGHDMSVTTLGTSPNRTYVIQW